MEVDYANGEAISLYIGLKPDEQVDLEVAAAAAIEWSRSIKAAAAAISPDFEYKVRLIAAKPGSNKWLARIERLPINKAIQDAERGFSELPIILRLVISLAVVIPTTVIPTYNQFWGDKGFSPEQLEQIDSALEKALASDEVRIHRKSMYKEVQKDKNITGIGGGVPDSDNWKPLEMIPSSRFAEADGLFDIKDGDPKTKTTYNTLDVILVTPQLINAKRAWVFRQPGIPGQFSATMSDIEFLTALEANGVHETLRTNIPMRIMIKIEEEFISGEWKTKRGGRSVIKVISPSPGATELLDHNTKP